jgi:hypothetical protein
MVNGELKATSLDCYLAMELGEDGDLFNLRSVPLFIRSISSGTYGRIRGGVDRPWSFTGSPWGL